MSGILQTPEFFRAKEEQAAYAIGRHLLISTFFNGGVAIGMRFDPRRNVPLQWIKLIVPHILVVGWGEYSHFETVSGYIVQEAQRLTDCVGENYVTLPAISKILSPFFKKEFEVAIPYSLDILLIDVKDYKLRLLGFKSDLTLLHSFGALGGYPYVDENEWEKVIKKGNPAESAEIDSELRNLAMNLKFPRKLAIAHLDKKFKSREILENKKEAIDLVKETLFKFDPPSKKELFNLVSYEPEGDKGKLESKIEIRKTK